MHWIKNFLVALPLLMSGNFDSDNIVSVIFGIVSFSLLSSAVYILNDVLDIEHDRMHQNKWRRPLASASIPVEKAILLAFFIDWDNLHLSLASILLYHAFGCIPFA